MKRDETRAERRRRAFAASRVPAVMSPAVVFLTICLARAATTPGD